MRFTSQSTTIALALLLGFGAPSVTFAISLEILLVTPLLLLLRIYGLPGALGTGLLDSLLFWYRGNARFTSDWGVVQFKGGRSIRVQFLLD